MGSCFLRSLSLSHSLLLPSPLFSRAEGAASAFPRTPPRPGLGCRTGRGSGIDIACSHPNIQSNDYIYWYRQFPGQGPAFLVRAYSGSEDVTDPAGRLSVAADRRSSALWLTDPRLRDAAVYYWHLSSLFA
uniref:Immunoglobulin V-set domain-containing protein n=1 Tax=Anas platyrhynchos TaxID=8839 RepID=A0A8B9R5T7_ANAPL